MTWLSVFQALLALASFVARRLDRADVEKAVLDALQVDFSNKAADAGAARDAVLTGGVPVDVFDPNRRD